MDPLQDLADKIKADPDHAHQLMEQYLDEHPEILSTLQLVDKGLRQFQMYLESYQHYLDGTDGQILFVRFARKLSEAQESGKELIRFITSQG